jgi:hypothetical protein
MEKAEEGEEAAGDFGKTGNRASNCKSTAHWSVFLGPVDKHLNLAGGDAGDAWAASFG